MAKSIYQPSSLGVCVLYDDHHSEVALSIGSLIPFKISKSSQNGFSEPVAWYKYVLDLHHFENPLCPSDKSLVSLALFLTLIVSFVHIRADS